MTAGFTVGAQAPLAAQPAAAAAGPRQPLPFTLDPFPSTYQSLPRVDTLITGATVLDGAGHRLENTSLLLQAGKITAIGSDLQAPAGATVIDARGRWVTPGIVDIHSHLGNFAFPYTSQDLLHSDVSEDSDPNAGNVWAEHSITVQDPSFSRAIAAGVTTVQVLPGSGTLFGGRTVVLKNVPAVTVQQMKFPGAAYGLKMACGENPKHNFGDSGRAPGSRMGNVAGYREAFQRAQDYLQKWEAYETGKIAEPPPRDARLETLAGALRGDIKVHIHCYRADEMAQLLDVAREYKFHITAFHHAVESYKIANQLREAGVCSVAWSDWWGYKLETFDAIRENAAFIDAAGACVTLHSDSPYLDQRLVMEASKAMASGNRAGLGITREHAIGWVTSAPARALGLGDQIGSLEAGKNADVVVWSGDPFSVYTKAQQVFLDGALVFDAGNPARRPRTDFDVGQPSLEPRP